ncbi:MAG TPA: sigma-70 family RNA polymerase sigma factor [Acidimicrobiales bacterium]
MLDFEAFFAREYEPVTRALTLALGDRRSAEDAAQEGFARALNSWSRVKDMDRPAAWVYVVAMRHERRRTLRDRMPLPVHRRARRDEPAEVENRVLVTALLSQLTPRQRMAVVLRYHADLSLQEVAKALGCRVGTAKATLHQSLTRLNNAIERDGSDARL